MQRIRVVFDVSDSGPGVPLAERAAIFDRYGQGRSGRAAGGAGLGLAIAKAIAEAHRGTLTVGDAELGGASFGLLVPAGE